MTIHLQNRWTYENGVLKYYGMRRKPHTLKNTVPLGRRQARVVAALPKVLDAKETKACRELLEQGILVAEHALKTTPRSFEDATYCTQCVANDFMIPGLEWSDSGLCPMCDHAEETKHFKSVLPVKNTFEKAKKSRFDVAVFYTGGKDSTYLLHYLANVSGLRVLALTWEIPFMSDSARQSLENAKRRFRNVEFLHRKMCDADLKPFYRALHARAGNTCACPSLAYVLFYPTLVNERVPYFVAGNEPAQLLNLYFNRFAPKIAYNEKAHRLLVVLTNVLRIATLRKPLKKGQVPTLLTMKQLAYGDPLLKRLSSIRQPLLSDIIAAFDDIPNIKEPLRRALRVSNWSGRVPAFVQIDFNDISGGRYDWKTVKETLVEEAGWVAPAATDKGLHTSCMIEKCKDHTQFVAFTEMKSQMIPFSAIEMAVASRAEQLSKEEAIAEMKRHLGFSLQREATCAIMERYLQD